MSENRFRITTIPKSNAVAFDEKEKKYYIGIDFEGLLNEQQSTIQSLKEGLKLEQDFASRWQKESEMLAKENEQLRKKLEQIYGFKGLNCRGVR